MEIRLRRLYQNDNYTIGKVYIDGEYFCDSVEDRVRDLNKDGDLNDPGEEKVYGQTAIPYGVYDVILSVSPKFGRVLPLILNVPHFEGIRIHRMTTAKDSAGCIGLGENKIKGGVLNSAEYEKEIIQLMLDEIYRGRSIRITIT
jgi:hypothetical protein